ncbi:MAG: glyoxalase [Glaciihabitans sp.]|nr:glyoxalase [Glaciihabitans sp.]
MFTPDNAFSGFSVDDIDAARAFYSETLGLKVTDNEMGFLNLHLASGARVLIYPKPGHTPAGYTILNFAVDDVSTAVDDLNARGVRMQHYAGMPQDGSGVMTGNGPDIAWFIDPAGNVLSVVADET